MNLIYFAIEDPELSPGVSGKIIQQADLLRKEGNKVKVVFIIYNPEMEKSYRVNDFKKYRVLEVRTGKIPVVSKFFNRRKVFKAARKLLAGESFDYVYFRYPHYLDQSFHIFTSSIPKRIILESQTKERPEFISRKQYLKAFWERIYKPLIFKNLYACITVTDEIKSYQKKFDKKGKLQFRTITNGINVEDLQPAQVKSFPRDKLHILYVGTLFPHHGLDRLLKGMAKYNGPLKIKFSIIGQGPELKRLKRIVQDCKLMESVQFEGVKRGNELDEYFNEAHIGIGALAIHRKGLKEAAPLKVRDYSARGLPFVMSGIDKDFEMQEEISNCYLKIPSDNSSVDLETLIGFVKQFYYSEPELKASKLREFAKRKLDMSIKMKELSDFLNETGETS